MKRALLVSTGTVLGLYGTLSYVPSQAATNVDLAMGLGGPDLPSPTATDGTSASPTTSTTAEPSPTPSAASSTSAPQPSTSSTAGNTAKPKPKPTTAKPKPSASPSTGGVQDGDFTGTSERAGRYGVVQVQIRVTGGKLVDLGVLSYPDADPESRAISGHSIPLLRQEALTSQSAAISAISGASFTSMAFIKSLAAALAKAGL